MASTKPRPKASATRKHFAIRLAATAAPVNKPRRVYLICSADGPVAAVPGGDTGEEDIARAGFANCPVKWDLPVTYRELRLSLDLLPRLASKAKRR